MDAHFNFALDSSSSVQSLCTARGTSSSQEGKDWSGSADLMSTDDMVVEQQQCVRFQQLWPKSCLIHPYNSFPQYRQAPCSHVLGDVVPSVVASTQ